MKPILNIITVTKDDLDGASATLKSTIRLREDSGVRQIIVDGSSEQISGRIRGLLEVEKNVDYVWQPPTGIAAAFNKGISVSTADWLWFLNGGDEVLPDLDPSWLLALIERTRADAIVFELLDGGRRWQHPPLWEVWPPLVTWLPHPATLTRRALYEKYGNFNESFSIAMDHEFWLRCFSKNVTVDMISLPLVKFDTGGVSSQHTALTSTESLRVLKMYLWTVIKKLANHGLLIVRAWVHHIKRARGI